jgi:N-hydroxyarylamine O-acetyltransferase
LRRIEYGGPLAPTRQTLHHLHRAHLLAIPFENIDVQLRVRNPFDLDTVFDKLVEQQRGGWCYEMNGLFGWALRELGFNVEFAAGAANRKKNGDTALMNHLVLIVHLDEPYLADVGFGNGALTPAPLREGSFHDGRFEFRLGREGEWWRFYNHRQDGSTYDFTEQPYAYGDFEAKARLLATTAESSFVQNLVVMKATDDGFIHLVNTVLQVHSSTEILEETAPNPDEFSRILKQYFNLAPERIEALWHRASSQHKTWLRKRIRGF